MSETTTSGDDGPTRKELYQSVWLLGTAILGINLAMFGVVFLNQGDLAFGLLAMLTAVVAMLFHEAVQGRGYARALFEVLNRGPIDWDAKFPEVEG